jgi:2,4-dienoyl-CoA reductase-like NADH-dependent reductase (Old Yellow Enzyme family)
MEAGMSKLFEITEISGMTLKNRFVRSATWTGMAENDGTCTTNLVTLIGELAAGGVGLIITGHAYVHETGRAGPWQLGIYKDEHIPALRNMTQAVHTKNAKIVMQLAHAGIYADTDLTGQRPLAPSAIHDFTDKAPREMTTEDIVSIIEAFASAAERAKAADFDGVQMHAAHGYLLNQFLSPAYNKRQDQYGSSIENRTRFLQEVLVAIRKRVGHNYPILIKINSQDYIEGGLELADAIKACNLLKAEGLSAVEISGGTRESGKLIPVRTAITTEDREAYFKDAAIAFKKSVDLPIILVGGIRSFHIAREIVEDNIADYISMSRPFIREPGLINRWKSGDLGRATCLSDSKCFVPIRNGEGVYCVVEKKLRHKLAGDSSR